MLHLRHQRSAIYNEVKNQEAMNHYNSYQSLFQQYTEIEMKNRELLKLNEETQKELEIMKSGQNQKKIQLETFIIELVHKKQQLSQLIKSKSDEKK